MQHSSTFLKRILRLVGGIALVLVMVVVGFQITGALISNWGATPVEASQQLPGDERLPNAPIKWNHAETIRALPEAVWPWIAQMGDDRAGFYSYMFIERTVDPTPGRYVNASSIHPEWQNPAVGMGIIQTQLDIAALEPGKYLLASASKENPLGWTWLWYITPAADGQTRLNVHMRIQPPPGPENPVLNTFIGLGAFIMERNMMTGLKVRAEGGGEPGLIEPLEIALWFAALLVGLVAGGSFIFAARWWKPLAVGLCAIAALFVLTFVQPAIWLRVLIDLALLGGLAWAFEAPWLARKGKSIPAHQPSPVR